jgi:glycine cleavage system T protein
MAQLVDSRPLSALDPIVAGIVEREAERQKRKLILIASESICPPAVREALSCEFGNLYAEGYPSPRTLSEPLDKLQSFAHQLAWFRRYSNRRYYKGCEYADILEAVCRRRTAEVFANENASAEEIFVNVQPLSGAAANNAVYNAFARPGDVVMGAALTHGGHLTHGSPVNRSGANFRIVPYELSPGGRLDYDAVEKLAVEHRPKLLIGGFSAFPWDIDWKRMRQIADRVGAVLLADIAHLAGMVAAGLLNNPVGVAHVVSFTTHKTLCGPRGAMLLCTDPHIAARLDFGVFPGEQGGPHIHTIAAKAVAMAMAKTEEFRALQRRVLENARALADGFVAEGLALAYGGTNTHMCLLDLRKLKTPTGEPLTGEIASRILDLAGIVCNKNTIAGDTNAVHPSGLRFGATWVTQRGFGPQHMRKLASLIAGVLRAIQPFSYMGARLEWGRGKIDPSVIERAAREVEELLRQAGSDPAPAAFEAYPHYAPPPPPAARHGALHAFLQKHNVRTGEKNGFVSPLSGGKPEEEKQAVERGCAIYPPLYAVTVEVSGPRAAHFLETACTSNVLSLPPGRADLTMVADPKGALLGHGLLVREPEPCPEPRYYLVLHTREPERLLRWLRGLSDGYFLQDDDLWLKAEGPVVIEDIERPSDERPARAVLGLRGGRYGEVGQKALGRALPEAGAVERTDFGLVWGRPAALGGGAFVLAETARLQTLAERLLESGATLVGAEALPDPLAAGDTLVQRMKGVWKQAVARGKPFFVGQRALRKAEPPEPRTAVAFAWKAPAAELKKTCLYSEHEKRTSAKHLVPFAGWKMPVMYTGILEEHAAVRKHGGLFDVSHMGCLEVSGPHAERFLDVVTANYVPMLAPGQAQYSYLLAHDGRCIDDIIVYRRGPERFLVVVNAANADEDEAWLRAVLDGSVLLDPERPEVRFDLPVTLRNLKDPACGADCRVDLALQGPRSRDALNRLIDDARFRLELERLRKFCLIQGRVAGVDTIIARTGYTGEETGYELFVHPERAREVWNAVLDAGAADGIVPVGLGARDSTRTEAGYPLHGHELAGPNRINPLEAGYGSFVKLHKPFFVGRAAMLEAHKKRERVVVRFEVDEKGGKVLRPGMPVLEGRKGEYTGVVTSAASTGERQVGLALIRTRHAKVGGKLFVLPVAEGEKAPPACSPATLKSGDWMAIPRSCTILPRFMRPGEKPQT